MTNTAAPTAQDVAAAIVATEQTATALAATGTHQEARRQATAAWDAARHDADALIAAYGDANGTDRQGTLRAAQATR